MNPEPEDRDDEALIDLLRRSPPPTRGAEPDEGATLAFLFGHPTEDQRREVERALVESPGFRSRFEALRAESSRDVTESEREAFSDLEPEALTPLALKAALRRAGFEAPSESSRTGERWWSRLWTWRAGFAMATAGVLLVVGAPILDRALRGTRTGGTGGPGEVAIVEPGTRDSLSTALPPNDLPVDSTRGEIPRSSLPGPGSVPMGESTGSAPRAPLIDQPPPTPPEAIVQRTTPRVLAPGERIQFGTTPDAKGESVEMAKRIAAELGNTGNTTDGRFLVEFGTLGSPQPARASRPGQPAPERVRMLPYRVVDLWTGRSLPEKELRIGEGDAAAVAPADRLIGILREQPWAGRVIAVRGDEFDLVGTGRGAPKVGDRVRILERGPEILRSDTGTLAGYRTRQIGVAIVTTAADAQWTARVESSLSPPALGMSVVRSDEP